MDFRNFLQSLMGQQPPQGMPAPSMPQQQMQQPAPMPQMQGDLQQMTAGTPNDPRMSNIMQAIGGTPDTSPVQMPAQMQQPQQQEAPRKRRSFLDTVGQISDVLARVGGAEAMYQPTLDAREDRTRQLDLDEMRKQMLDQQITQGGQARLAQALGAVAQNPDAAAMWSQIAAEAGIPEDQAARIGAIIQSNPNAAGIFAQSLGWSPEVGKGRASQAKEVQIYELLNSSDPSLGEAYLRSLINPGSMSEYQTAQLGIAMQRLGIDEEKFAFEREKFENPPESAQQRTQREKIRASFPKVSASFRSATNDINKQIRDLRQLRDHKGLGGITGAIEGRMGFSVLPSSNAAQALLKTIQARAGFNTLQEMRNNSPTGGALGSVSNAEGDRLIAAAASLDTAQERADFQASIDKYINDLEFSKNNLKQAFDETYEGINDPPARPAPRQQAPTGRGSAPAGPRRSVSAAAAEARRRGLIQ